ncbi:MAG: glycosyltransferase family 1 protein [Gammaproteobacteria bacterium]|nr:glycosyltransferase family 1 protein [Gammaproteobacteria bacterium]
MRIGIALSGLRPVDGGGHTFQQGLVAAIERDPGQHSWVIFDLGSGEHRPDADIPRINLIEAYRGGRIERLQRRWRRARLRITGRDPRTLPSSLEQAARDHAVDLVWYLAPFEQRVTVPYVCTVWDLQHRLQPWFPEVSRTGWSWDERETLYRALLPRATAILTGAEAGRQEILQFYAPAPENVHVLPLPTPEFQDIGDSQDDAQCLRKFGLEPGYLFYPAQFWPHKNHANLLRAVQILNRDRQAKLTLALTGADKGNRGYVQRLIDQAGLADQVIITGFVSERELVALYRQAAALVFPSFFGPDNLPPLEAFALGCPVAAANVNGAAEQLGDSAILFDPRDPAAIASAVQRVVDDADLCAGLRESGLARAARWTPADYLAAVREFLDDFGRIQRCWDAGYEQNN